MGCVFRWPLVRIWEVQKWEVLVRYNIVPLASGDTWNVTIIESPLRMGQFRADGYSEDAFHFTRVQYFIFNTIKEKLIRPARKLQNKKARAWDKNSRNKRWNSKFDSFSKCSKRNWGGGKIVGWESWTATNNIWRTSRPIGRARKSRFCSYEERHDSKGELGCNRLQKNFRSTSTPDHQTCYSRKSASAVRIEENGNKLQW